jgi:hypothetical protein
MVEAMAADLLPQVVRILRRSDPSTDPVHVRERLVGALSSDDDRFDRFLERELPGVDATVLTSLEVSLRMPGRLVETNADEREDGVVRWELDLSEAIRGPIEIYARSEVDGR